MGQFDSLSGAVLTPAVAVPLSNLRQIDALAERLPVALERCTLVALNHVIEAELKRRGHAAMPMMAAFAPPDLERVHAEAMAMERAFLRHAAHGLRYRGISLPLLEWEALNWFFVNAATASFAFERMRQLPQGLERLLLVGMGGRPCVYYYEHDTVNPVLAHLAETAGIAVTVVDHPTFAATDSPDYLPHVPSGGLRADPPPRRSGRTRIGLVLHGMNGAATMAQLLSRAGYDVIGLVSYPPSPDVADVVERTITTVHIGIGEEEAWHGRQTVADAGRDLMAALQRNYRGPHPEVFANPYLDFHYRYYTRWRWPQLARLAEALDAQLDQLELDGLVTSNLPDSENLLLLRLARRKGIATVMAQHSGWPGSLYMLPEADVTLLWSHSHQRAIDEHGFGHQPTVVTGALGFDAPSPVPAETVRAERSRIGARFGIPEKRRIVLLVASIIGMGILPAVPIPETMAMVGALLDIPTELRAQVHLVVKIKDEMEHAHLYRAAAELAGTADNLTVIADEPLERVAAMADAAVGINYATTGFLDPVFQEKPFIHACNVPTPFWEGRLPQAPTGMYHTVERPEDLWPALRRCLFDPGFARDVRETTLSFIEQDMPLGQAAERMLSVIGAVVAQGPRPVPGGGPFS